MKRESKIHFVPVNDGYQKTQCGTPGRLTYVLNDVTCRVCWYRHLSSLATWAPKFLEDLRGGKGPTIRAPAPTTEQVDPLIKYFRSALGSPFRHQAGSQKAIGELLPVPPAPTGAVQPIMQGCGTTTKAVGIENRQVAQYARDTGQIGDESRRNDESPELWGTPDERSPHRP